MKLIAISPQHLHVDRPLPFGLRDDGGRLLLAAGHTIADLQHLQALIAQPLFAEEGEAAAWTRLLTAAMDDVIRQGGSISQVVAVRPPTQRERVRPPVLSLTEQWLEQVMHLDALLREARGGADWPARLLALHQQARELAARRPDAALYHLVYESGRTSSQHTARHALLTLVICEQAAPMLGWAADWVHSLGLAALAMNAAAVRTLDQCARQASPAASLHAALRDHAEEGAALLQAAGLDDPLALQVVRLHHDDDDAAQPLAALTPPLRLARLLRRVDRFALQISCQAARPPASPVQAARQACLGADGKPDEIGAALLRAVGLYPPGSFVELATGEIGIVVGRGRLANVPFVAALIGASGSPMGEPLLRDTLERRHAVKGVVPPGRVRVLPPHERLMAMR